MWSLSFSLCSSTHVWPKPPHPVHKFLWNPAKWFLLASGDGCCNGLASVLLSELFDSVWFLLKILPKISMMLLSQPKPNTPISLVYIFTIRLDKGICTSQTTSVHYSCICWYTHICRYLHMCQSLLPSTAKQMTEGKQTLPLKLEKAPVNDTKTWKKPRKKAEGRNGGIVCLPIPFQISQKRFKFHFTKGIEALLERARKWRGDGERTRDKEATATFLSRGPNSENITQK